MPFIQVFLLSLSVAADAFACSVARGTLIRVNAFRRSLVLAAVFGVFQSVMPVLGWLIGVLFAGVDLIARIDHWIAFALLAVVGAKMIRDAFHPDAGQDVVDDGRIQLRPAIILGIATSIDALAVGMGLAFVAVPIIQVALVMGVMTFLMSLAGAWLGHHGGGRFGRWATLAGGLVLIGLGVDILLEHLMA